MSISGVHCIPRNPASGYNAALATLKDNPAEGNSRAKRAKKGDATQREFRVSYFSVAHPARNENCLAGLEVGALRRARRSISDFATLVRKSYSGSPSLVSTLVLVEHFLLCWRTWGFLDSPYSAAGISRGGTRMTTYDCRSTT